MRANSALSRHTDNVANYRQLLGKKRKQCVVLRSLGCVARRVMTSRENPHSGDLVHGVSLPSLVRLQTA